MNDVTKKVTAQGGICLPIGIGAACLGFCAAMITTIFGDAFGMDPTAMKTLSENIAMAEVPTVRLNNHLKNFLRLYLNIFITSN